MELHSSLENLGDEIWEWFLTLRIPEHPGWVRFCREGAVFEPGAKAGLGMSCLALKTLHMLNMLERLDPGEKESWTAYIQSFQTKKGRSAGYFKDPGLLRVLGWRSWLRGFGLAVQRAETRQACAALMCVGANPKWAITSIPQTSRSVKRFLHRLPWKTPWAAGSHASHLMAFFHINRMLDYSSAEESFLPVILNELDALQDPDTGCWFRGKPSSEQMINGAMKVITGYAFVGLPFKYAERLIDFALTLANDLDACHHADLIYVLHQCKRLTEHRFMEIQSVAERRLSEIVRFRRKDGAFSFREDGAGLNYYGVPMSRGLPVSDIHGTTLFVWTAVMISDLLGSMTALKWRLPVT